MRPQRMMGIVTGVAMLAALLPPVVLQAAPASAVASVRYIYRGLGVQPPHQAFHAGHRKDALFALDNLRTQQNQKASIGFHDGTVLQLNQNTDAILNAHQTQVQHGEVAEYLAPGTNHSVQTAAAVASAIGTTFDIRTTGTITVFVVLHGALQVRNGVGGVVVTSNHQTSVTPGHAPLPPSPVDAQAAFAWTSGIPAPDLGEDIALDANGGQIVSFSSQREGPGDTGHAIHINDGLLTTGWQSARGKVANQQVTVSFFGGTFYRISDLIIDPAATNGDPATEDLRDFAFQVSSTGTDAASFTTVFRGTCKRQDALQHFTLPVPVRAKYARLVMLSNYGSRQRVAVAEWEVVATSSLFAQPTGLAVGPRGDLYVADTNSDRIDLLSPHGKLLAHFGHKGSGPGQFLGPSGIAVDAHGAIYVADTFNQRVEVLSPRGRFLRAWGSNGLGNGQFQYPRGIAVDALGNVYVADIGGNPADLSHVFIRVQKFSSTGRFITAWNTLADAGSLSSSAGLTIDRRGNLWVADSGADTILKVSPTGRLLATIGAKGTGPGQFDGPTDVAVDRAGNLYVVDAFNDRVQKLDATGRPLASWGTFGYSRGQFALPDGVAVDGKGNVFVADSYNGRIQKLSTANGKVRTIWGKFATIPTLLGQPAGIAVDPHGDIWITDSTNDRIQVRSSGGRVLAVLGYHGNVLGKPVRTGLGQFSNPHGIAIDTRGEAYVADTNNDRIQQLAPRGPIGALGGSGQLSGPQGIAVDRQGNLYVADTYNNRVQKLSATGAVLWSVGSKGTGPGQFEDPIGIAVDSTGNVYVSNFGDPATATIDGRIEKLSTDGKLLAVWGTPDPLGESRFAAPQGLAVDGQGNLYVADSGHNAVQKLSPDGAVLQVYEIPGPNANPVAVTVDARGNLYVADSLNRRVFKLAPDGEVLAIWS